MKAKYACCLVISLLVVLACVAVVAGCGSSSAARNDRVAALVDELHLSEEDAAILAEIDEILAGIESGTVVVPEDGPAGDIPTDIDEFLEAMGYSSSRPDVSVYLKDSVDTAPALFDEIKAMPGVLTCTFVSKEDALVRMKELFADQPEQFENLTSNPLPASFEVTLGSRSDSAAFVAELESRAEVDEVVERSSSLDLEAVLFGLRFMSRDLSELDRVRSLEVFGPDRCLGWNPLLNFGEPGPGPLRCFDSGGRQVWSLELDGYGAEFVYGSPVNEVAVILASKWVTPDDQQYRVLLVTSDPSFSPGAEADNPTVTVLRELPPPEDGFYAPRAALARDGRSVGLYLIRSFFGSDGNFADESTLEVMDTKGDVIWRVELAESSLPFPRVAFDQALATAALVMADPITDDDPGFEPYVLVCRSSGKTERLDSSTLGLPPQARMHEVSLSPDGKMLAIKSYGVPGYDSAISLCSLEPEIKLKWTVDSSCELPLFSADGRSLVCAYGTYDSMGSSREVQVLSVAEGSVLWEKTDQVFDEDNLTDSTGSSMWQFDSGFVWRGLSEPRSAFLVDLTGTTPKVTLLDDGVGSPVFLPGKRVIVGISEDGGVVAIPRP